MISRRKTREFLLQSLYARVTLGSSFDRDIFFASYFLSEQKETLDTIYLDTMETAIIEHEALLLGLVERIAPKFEIATLPYIHVLIMVLALAEMIYLGDETVPQSVSMNEAIELAKTFSDEQGKGFINGALSTFLKDREQLLQSPKTSDFRIFIS